MSKASKNKLFEQITDMSNKIYEHKNKANYMTIISASTKTNKLLASVAKKEQKKLLRKAYRQMLYDSLEDAHNWYCPECYEWGAPFGINWKFDSRKKVWQHFHRAIKGWVDGKRKPLDEN